LQFAVVQDLQRSDDPQPSPVTSALFRALPLDSDHFPSIPINSSLFCRRTWTVRHRREIPAIEAGRAFRYLGGWKAIDPTSCDRRKTDQEGDRA
jgi:hypothetical protein